MSLVINTNLSANSAARLLGNHYSDMSTLVRRLSSGLRVSGAADDAAGLAIRELMRADITALNQGIRNANDAISMMQTADGALQVIDEKLIRMKELSEQAATGTYNSTQRLIIDNEFQAMKSEIDRIANATDFNNIKMLCMDTANKLNVGGDGILGQPPSVGGPGGRDSSMLKILNPDALTADAAIIYSNALEGIAGFSGDPAIAGWKGSGYYVGKGGPLYTTLSTAGVTFSYASGTNTWDVDDATKATLAAAKATYIVKATATNVMLEIALEHDLQPSLGWGAKGNVPLTADASIIAKDTRPGLFVSGQAEYPDIKLVSMPAGFPGLDIFGFDLDNDGVMDIQFDQGPELGEQYVNIDVQGGVRGSDEPYYVTKIHFGTGNDSAEDYYYIESRDCTAKGLGIDTANVRTQGVAQSTLVTLDDAIVLKDAARAYFGAMQNRLENTISNLQIQAENLQASESRISDVDVAHEMTELVRTQVMSQAAVAMLGQANSLPQMALQLLG